MNSYSMNCNCRPNPRPCGSMTARMPDAFCGCQDRKPEKPEKPEYHPCPRSEHQTLAIASVRWQTWKNVMDGGSGLIHGSIFEDLVLPFIGKKAACAHCAHPSYQGRDRR
ncbi:MAG: spore coat associated protein CotJA [Eubacterium sp.]